MLTKEQILDIIKKIEERIRLIPDELYNSPEGWRILNENIEALDLENIEKNLKIEIRSLSNDKS